MNIFIYNLNSLDNKKDLLIKIFHVHFIPLLVFLIFLSNLILTNILMWIIIIIYIKKKIIISWIIIEMYLKFINKINLEIHLIIKFYENHEKFINDNNYNLFIYKIMNIIYLFLLLLITEIFIIINIWNNI